MFVNGTNTYNNLERCEYSLDFQAPLPQAYIIAQPLTPCEKFQSFVHTYLTVLNTVVVTARAMIGL